MIIKIIQMERETGFLLFANSYLFRQIPDGGGGGGG